MGIEATTSASAATAAQSTTATTTSKANSSDTSFKDEMSKVTEPESKKDTKTADKDSKDLKGEQKTDKNDNKLALSKSENERKAALQSDAENKLQGAAVLNGQYLMNDANMMLSNDIQQMIDNTVSVNASNLKNWSFGFGENGTKSALKMNESDADFFINLTQNEDVNVQSIHAQAQSMVNNGVEVAEVKQNVQVSQALLNALSEARENNQPLRIDFDQNISVILRVGRDGAVSAQFIPGDKAVEQYLRNNIESLKASFDEQDLPYSELSYSHSSKDQNQRRRQEKQQGE